MLINNPPAEIVEGVRMLGTNEYPVFLVTDDNEGAIFEGGVGAAGLVAKEQLNEMNISGDMNEFWNRLAEVGNDPYAYSSWRLPSLYFADVQFSGI